jgi:hypothetical protein
MTFSKICACCGREIELPVTKDQFDRLFRASQSDELIQDVAPDVAPEWREMFISGTCPECWDAMFVADEE